jgi:hypothetical protein
MGWCLDVTRFVSSKRSLHVKEHRYRRVRRKGRFESLELRLALSGTQGSLDYLGSLDVAANQAAMAIGTKVGYELAALGASGQKAADSSKFQLINDSIAIQAIASSDIASLSTDLKRIGMTAMTVSQHIVTGLLPLTAIWELGELGSLSFVSPLYGGTGSVGLAQTSGDISQRTDLIRDFQGFTGNGVSIGVISDSFDNGGVGSAATDVASGDLPGVGNPNGNVMPVNIVRDNTLGVDEGRAMAQIVHDVVPEAAISFANVSNAMGLRTQAGMAENIRSLAARINPTDPAANVIVDDWVFFAEPFFMDGLVAQAVDEIVGEGVTYVSAAGNMAADSYEVASYVNSGQTLSVTVGGGAVIQDILHDFGGGDTWQQVTIPPGRTVFSFQWDDPFRTVAAASTGATRDYNIWVRDLGVVNTIRAGSFNSILGVDPVEVVELNNATGANQVIEIALGWHASVAGVNDAGRLKYVMFSPGSAGVINEFATNSPTLYGHANAEGAIAVGAAAYFNTPEFDPAAPFVPPTLNNFSALGGTPILFDVAGNRLATPINRGGVDVVGPDNVNTTFFGTDIVNDADALPNFGGTSAAAPHVAGLAALLLQADPRLDPAGIEAALEDSAIDMDNPFTVGFDIGADAATGHGFVDALGALGVVWDLPQLENLEPDDYILVNRTNDALDANAGDGVVDIDLITPGNQVSLRAAIIAANAGGANARTLLVPAGNYNLSLTGTEGTANTAVHDLDITGNVRIIGSGAGATVISAGGVAGINDRVFEVRPLGELDLARVTVTGGNVAASGGGIVVYSANGGAEGTNPATLTLTDVAIVGNTAGAVGSGIYNRGRFGNTTINRSVIANNHANNTSTGNRMAGGLYSDRKPLTLSETIVAGNTANFLFTDGFSDPALDLVVTTASTLTSAGNNLLGDIGTNLPARLIASDLYNGAPGRIVTSVADTFSASPNLSTLSLRDAIHWANNDPGSDEIWMPAWDFVLTQQRTSLPNAVDMDVWQGDLDIRQSLTARGVNGQTSVAWRRGVVDAIFDLIGDYNGDGIANGLDNGGVGSEDYTIWQDTLGSTTDLRADGNDNGVIDGGDYTEWVNHFGNTFTRIGVTV